MLPDFPELKERLKEKYKEIVEANMHNDPFLSRYRNTIVHEGNVSSIITPDGYSSKSGYEQNVSEFFVDTKTVLEKGPEAFFEQALNTAKNMTKNLLKQVYSAFDKAANDAGNVVKGDGTGLTPNLILDCIEKMEIDFDEQGNPIMPTFVVNPKTYETYLNKEKEWESQVPVIEQRRQEIIEKKRKEHLDRASRRKLVD
jgi:hypothetical protein